MPKQKNIATVAKLEEKLQKAKGLVLTNYQGLTHKQMEDLHKALRKVDAEYVVVKNSLLKIASKNTTASTGPTAVVLAYGEEVTPLKELFKFIKTYSLPKVKGGTIYNQTYEASEITRIASLPDKVGLIAQLMFTLNANTQKLAYLLTQIHKS